MNGEWWGVSGEVWVVSGEKWEFSCGEKRGNIGDGGSTGACSLFPFGPLIHACVNTWECTRWPPTNTPLHMLIIQVLTRANGWNPLCGRNTWLTAVLYSTITIIWYHIIYHHLISYQDKTMAFIQFIVLSHWDTMSSLATLFHQPTLLTLSTLSTLFCNWTNSILSLRKYYPDTEPSCNSWSTLIMSSAMPSGASSQIAEALRLDRFIGGATGTCGLFVCLFVVLHPSNI